MAGERDADDAMWFVANSAFSSFSPVSFGQSENFAKYIAKVQLTVFKPLVEMAVNETYFGSRVYQLSPSVPSGLRQSSRFDLSRNQEHVSVVE